MFNGLGNLANIFKQAQAMQGRMTEVTDRLKSQRVTGTAGGGLVEVLVNGMGEAISVRLDEQLVARGDRELLEDLLPAAFNDAQRRVVELRQAAMTDVAGDMNIPGLDRMLERFTGQSTQP